MCKFVSLSKFESRNENECQQWRIQGGCLVEMPPPFDSHPLSIFATPPPLGEGVKEKGSFYIPEFSCTVPDRMCKVEVGPIREGCEKGVAKKNSCASRLHPPFQNPV